MGSKLRCRLFLGFLAFLMKSATNANGQRLCGDGLCCQTCCSVLELLDTDNTFNFVRCQEACFNDLANCDFGSNEPGALARQQGCIAGLNFVDDTTLSAVIVLGNEPTNVCCFDDGLAGTEDECVTNSPTESPTLSPTDSPTESPTESPTFSPTISTASGGLSPTDIYISAGSVSIGVVSLVFAIVLLRYKKKKTNRIKRSLTNIGSRRDSPTTISAEVVEENALGKLGDPSQGLEVFSECDSFWDKKMSRSLQS